MIKLFPARESLVSDKPAEDGKIANLFLKCIRRGEDKRVSVFKIKINCLEATDVGQ